MLIDDSFSIGVCGTLRVCGVLAREGVLGVEGVDTLTLIDFKVERERMVFSEGTFLYLRADLYRTTVFFV